MAGTMNEKWDELWKKIDLSSKEMNKFVTKSLTPVVAKKIEPFFYSFSKMLESAQHFDEFLSSPIDPVNVEMPWPDPQFRELWQYWKDYRLETFGKRYRSREEKKALEYLYDISGNKMETASRYLNFAMAGGYQRFFIVNEKDEHKPTSNTLDYDSDF